MILIMFGVHESFVCFKCFISINKSYVILLFNFRKLNIIIYQK